MHGAGEGDALPLPDDPASIEPTGAAVDVLQVCHVMLVSWRAGRTLEIVHAAAVYNMCCILTHQVMAAQDVAKTISTQLASAPQEIAQACFLPVTTFAFRVLLPFGACMS
jgi:hypothetical protein